ncbi:MAG: hypothetical protein K2F97_08245 [Muribaculaceae bacterium]|nr:hypothetical protein [Muribaculaceae bacterium]MDE6486037.1 hypothetical protein [Muribaculaceae bacterium]
MDIAIDTSRIVDELLADSAMGALTAAEDSAPLPLNSDHTPLLLRAVRGSFGHLALALTPFRDCSRHAPFVLSFPDLPGLDPDVIAEGAALFIRLDVAARLNASRRPADAYRLARQADQSLDRIKAAIFACSPRPGRIRPGA